MTDLHCHILPGIDDGAHNPDASIQLLQMEDRDGVNQIVLTPHFNSERETVEEFCQKRRRGVMALAEPLQKSGLKIEFKLGAEIYFSPALPELDLKKLCLSGTDILLIELPVDYNPGWTKEILFDIQMQGFRPLLAHVDRYPYVLEHPEMLYELVCAGIYTHMNASSLLRKPHETKQMKKLIGWNLVHTLATDAHSVHRRPAQLAKGLEQVRHWYGEEMVEGMIRNGDALFAGKEPTALPEPTEPKARFSLFR